jgi:hypothetical protein
MQATETTPVETRPYAPTMEPSAPVRLQFGHDHAAGSPRWFISGLLDVADLGLQSDFADALVAWADEVDEHCTLPDHVWVGSDQNEFERRGDELAARLSDELGDGFVIERSTGPTPRRMFRSGSLPRDPDVVAQLQRVLSEAE